MKATSIPAKPRRIATGLLALFRLASVALTLLMLVIHFTPLVPWYARLLAGEWNDPAGDVLIVLGNAVQSDGTLGEVAYLRSVYAVRAWRHDRFHAIVLSGGTPGGAPVSQAAAMAEFLAGSGVPREILHLEDRSNSTRENALFTKALIERWPGTRVLLTSDAHMYRARRVFERAGMPVAPRPFPDVLKRSSRLVNRWACFWDLAAETLKIGYYAARGWI